MKTCSTCKKIKSFQEFYRNKSQADGLSHNCKLCAREMYNKIIQNNLEKNSKLSSEEIFDGTKICTKCKIPKLRILFDLNLRTYDALSSSCTDCKKNARNNSIHHMISIHRSSCLRTKKEDPLSEEELRFIMLNPCFYCLKIKSIYIYDKKDPKFGNFNGIDRIDNTKGYTKENSVACCWDCNFIKKACTLEMAKVMVELAKERSLFDKIRLIV